MIDLNEIHSLTDFTRNTKEMVRRLKKSRKPLVLTVNGKAEVVVQDAAAYQQMLDRLETIEGIQRGLEDVAHGRTMSVDEFAERMLRSA